MAIDLQDVLKERQTYEMCLNSVKADWKQLKYVDERFQTEELCREAIRQNSYALQFVTKQTPGLCLEAVRNRGETLVFVQDQTPEICLEAVKKNGWALDEIQTPEICLAAVKQNGNALKYVKDPTLEIRLAAVKQTGWALRYIPKREQTLPIAIAALKQEPSYSREYLAAKFRTPDVYKAAGCDYGPEDIAPSWRGTERARTETEREK